MDRSTRRNNTRKAQAHTLRTIEAKLSRSGVCPLSSYAGRVDHVGDHEKFLAGIRANHKDWANSNRETGTRASRNFIAR